MKTNQGSKFVFQNSESGSIFLETKESKLYVKIEEMITTGMTENKGLKVAELNRWRKE